MAEQHPQVVVAFLMAQQESIAALSAMDPGAVSQLVREFWHLEPEAGAKVVRDDVLFARGWHWPTENDARAVFETSKFLIDNRVIEQPLAWQQVRSAFARTAPLVREAYQRLGARPAMTEFTRTDTSDLRGLPVWEMERCSDRT